MIRVLNQSSLQGRVEKKCTESIATSVSGDCMMTFTQVSEPCLACRRILVYRPLRCLLEALGRTSLPYTCTTSTAPDGSQNHPLIKKPLFRFELWFCLFEPYLAGKTHQRCLVYEIAHKLGPRTASEFVSSQSSYRFEARCPLLDVLFLPPWWTLGCHTGQKQHQFLTNPLG